MAKNRRVKVTEYTEDPAHEVEEGAPMSSAVSDAAEDTYQNFMGQFGVEGVKVKVYRQTPTIKQYCFWGSPSEVDEEAIRLYHARQPYASEPATYIVQVDVHGEFRNSFPVSVAPQIATPGATVGGTSSSDGNMGMMFKMLMDQNARLEARLLAQSQQGEREPINALADAMLKLSQLQQVQSQPMPIDTLMKCIELGRTLNADGGGDWKATLLEVVRESMPAIQGMMAAGAKPVASTPQPTLASAEMKPSENPTMEQLQAQLKMGLEWLKRKCLAGSDPGLYIDWIIDNRENLPYGQLIHAIVTQPFSSFVQIDPEIGKPPYETFFTALYHGIREAFGGENSVAVDSGRTQGNPGNTKGNGAAGAKRSS